MRSTNQDHTQARASKPWRDDFDAIAVSMAEALRGKFDGWETVTAPDIVVEDRSGFGGGKAYRLTNSANPAAPEAALHILHEFFCPAIREPIFFDRQRIAHELFSGAGLSPNRIAEDPGKEWFVEEWAGDSLFKEEVSIGLVEEVARLVARTHAIDTAWYDDLRRRQCERYPALVDAPKGCHIWFFASFPHHFMDQFSEKLLRMWISAGPAPATEAGSRLVTTHGDVHRANLVRTGEGLKLVDMEAACVNYAVHDIGYSFGLLCETDELKQAFTRAYLVECGLRALPEDVFALRLDAERCKMATNFFDGNSLWQLVNLRKDRDDLGRTYPKLVAIADRALVDPDLAEEIVRLGFERCSAVNEVYREAGRPFLGIPVSVHCAAPRPVWRSKMAVNWDGTIQSTWERHRALVLGVDDRGKVVLTNCMNTQQRLLLRVSSGRVPITGLRAPTTAATPLYLAGRHANKALVLSETRRQYEGADIEFATVGSRENALAVHVEPDGVIRLADRPQQAFDCEGARISTGVRVQIYHNHCYDNQKFVLNDDATLSPIGNREVVWGMRDNDLVLVRKDDQRAERLTFGEELVAAARMEGPGTLVQGEPPARNAGHVLALESHPGMALSVGSCEGRNDVMSLVVVSIGDAEPFIVAADHLRLAHGGGMIALGIPIVAESLVRNA